MARHIPNEHGDCPHWCAGCRSERIVREAVSTKPSTEREHCEAVARDYAADGWQVDTDLLADLIARERQDARDAALEEAARHFDELAVSSLSPSRASARIRALKTGGTR